MAAARQPAGTRHVITLAGREIPFVLVRSARRRTVGMRVDAAGLRVSAPPQVSGEDITAVLRDHASWILRALHNAAQRAAATPALSFEHGTELLWLGQSLPVHRVPAAEAVPRALLPGETLDCIPVAADSEDPQAAVIAWYMAQAQPWFRRRAQVYGERLGRLPREVRVTSARGRWGSCTRNGVIRLNWRLMQASPEEIDYVVAHEVAHLAEMNHSAAFWDTVAALYPGWRSASDLLDARDRLYRRF